MKLKFRLTGLIGAAGALVVMLSAPAAATSAVMHAKSFAGYVATSSTGITSFTGSLNVPKITCPKTGSPVISVSAELSGSSDTVIFGLQANCFNGSLSALSASAFFCPLAGGSCDPSAGVSAVSGNSIQFSMSENKTTTTTIVTITNPAKKQTASASAHSLLSQTGLSATVGFCCTNKHGNVTPIPSFTPIKFSSLKFNGAILSTFKPTEFDMYDGTTLQVATSSISSTGGFSFTFKHV